MAEIEINDAAAVQWAHNVQRPDGWTYYSQASVVNLARAALRWLEAALEVRANLEQAQARIAELEAERDDALKRAEEAEGKLRAMESRMERIRLALLASMSDEQLAEARHE